MDSLKKSKGIQRVKNRLILGGKGKGVRVRKAAGLHRERERGTKNEKAQASARQHEDRGFRVSG